MRHASQIPDSVCPFLYWSQCKKGHAESAFRDACRTSSEVRIGDSGKGQTALLSMNVHFKFSQLNKK